MPVMSYCNRKAINVKLRRAGYALAPGQGDDNSTLLYKRLKERGIPFIIYTGYPKIEGDTSGGFYMSKPA
jgi:hypothetical protein